jgi:hypothetical protein
VPNDTALEVHMPSVQSAGGVKKVIKLGVSTGLSEVRVMKTVTAAVDSAAFVGVRVTTDFSTCVSEAMSIVRGMLEA